MSRSEARVLSLVGAAAASGVMSDREADSWRAAVRDPCGCSEGLFLAVVAAVGTTLSGPGAAVSMLARGVAGFAAGAVAGKVYGVAKGLRLVRYRRVELTKRLVELEAADPLTGAGPSRHQPRAAATALSDGSA